MAYDEKLAARMRKTIGDAKGLTEKAMFGGLAFMLHGNMFAGIMHVGHLLVRVPPGRHEELASRPHASTMEFGGRTMKGFVTVDPEGFAGDAALAAWIQVGRSFVETLPPKAAKKSPKKKAAPKK
jgi:hypothetical protein